MSFAQRWADGYRVAWEAGDPAAAAAVYHPDCVFRSAPFREPEPPIAYTTRVFPEARAQDAGCSVLRFDDRGLAVESRDNWHVEPGRRDPHATWGK
jgi:hypothetical protein